MLGRLQWLRQQIIAGKHISVHFTYNAQESKDKVRFVIDGNAGDRPQDSLFLDAALDLVTAAVSKSVTVDRGHRFSSGRSEVCFWLQRPENVPSPRGTSGYSKNSEMFSKMTRNEKEAAAPDDEEVSGAAETNLPSAPAVELQAVLSQTEACADGPAQSALETALPERGLRDEDVDWLHAVLVRHKELVSQKLRKSYHQIDYTTLNEEDAWARSMLYSTDDWCAKTKQDVRTLIRTGTMDRLVNDWLGPDLANLLYSCLPSDTEQTTA